MTRCLLITSILLLSFISLLFYPVECSVQINDKLQVDSVPITPELGNESKEKVSDFTSKQKAFFESFVVIVISEIGDKTFLIAAILAMTHNRMTIFAAASSALIIMTVLSALMGFALPNLVKREYTQLLAGLLFLFFGAKMIKEGLEMDGNEAQEELKEVEEELATVQRSRSDDTLEAGATETSTTTGEPRSIMGAINNLAQFIFSPVFVQTFVMTFLAEWGDRSQISTIALAAAEDFFFVTLGASIAHCLCTGAAIMGGRLLATKISVKTVTLIGAILFIVFGITTVYFSMSPE